MVPQELLGTTLEALSTASLVWVSPAPQAQEPLHWILALNSWPIQSKKVTGHLDLLSSACEQGKKKKKKTSEVLVPPLSCIYLISLCKLI